MPTYTFFDKDTEKGYSAYISSKAGEVLTPFQYNVQKYLEIFGKSKYGSEVIESDIETYEEAARLLGEYRMAFGPDWRLSITDPEDQKSWNQKNINSDGSWR